MTTALLIMLILIVIFTWAVLKVQDFRAEDH